MKYIISENQYKRLVNEQGWGGILNFLRMGSRSPVRRINLSKNTPSKGTFKPDSDLSIDIELSSDPCLEYKTEKEIVKELFDLCLKRSVNENPTKIDGWVKRLRKSVSGLGTSSDFMKVLSEIKTLNELCSVVQRYPMVDFYQSGESLFDAISGEMKISWMDIIESLINFIVELEIQDCKEYNLYLRA